MKKPLLLPATLVFTVLGGCGSTTSPQDATADASDVADAGDASDASCTNCMPVREDDGAVRYTVCQSTTQGCSCLIYPDGAVQDPAFC